MARPQKKGFDYFPFDVDFFRGVKIRITMARFGVEGVLLFIYLLSMIYSNGYYLDYNEDLIYIISSDLNIKLESVEEIISFFCKRSLFDNTLFTDKKVLTSTGIQKRYQEMVKERAKKRIVIVNKNLWLLNGDETQDFIKFTLNSDNSGNNTDYSVNNPSNSKNNTIKESKENKSKENKIKEESKATTGSENKSENKSDIVLLLPCTNGEYAVSTQQLNQLQQAYKNIDVMKSFRKMLDYLKCHPDSQRPLDAIENRIIMWLNEDNATALSKAGEGKQENLYNKENSYTRENTEIQENRKIPKGNKSDETSYDISIFEKYDIFE